VEPYDILELLAVFIFKFFPGITQQLNEVSQIIAHDLGGQYLSVEVRFEIDCLLE